VVATFVILLRAGVEASTIVVILLAYLNRFGQRQYFRHVYRRQCSDGIGDGPIGRHVLWHTEPS
jgi:high-affinity Fe2+/Pb2+ permease